MNLNDKDSAPYDVVFAFGSLHFVDLLTWSFYVPH